MKDTRFTVSRMLRRDQVERNLCILKVRGSEDIGTKTENQRTRPSRLRDPEDQRTSALADQGFRRQKAAFGSVLKIGKPELKESRGQEDTLKDPKSGRFEDKRTRGLQDIRIRGSNRP